MLVFLAHNNSVLMTGWMNMWATNRKGGRVILDYHKHAYKANNKFPAQLYVLDAFIILPKPIISFSEKLAQP